MSEYTEFIEGIPVHPYAASFDMMSDDELQALADDIKAHGQREPIVITYLDEAMFNEPVVIDGRNRYAACKLAGVEPKFRYAMSLDDREISPQVIADWIKSKNVHRRHMTREQRREYIKDEISANPDLPDYRIAKRVGASPHTVKRVREANPDLQVANEERVNTRGQIRPATYKPDPASPKPKRGPLTDTARNAALKAVKVSESWGRIIADDRFKKNRETIRDIHLSDLRRARKDLDAAIAALEGTGGGKVGSITEREHLDGLQRCANRLKGFLIGYGQAWGMREHPDRDQVLELLDEFDRPRFLEIEKEITWPPTKK